MKVIWLFVGQPKRAFNRDWTRGDYFSGKRLWGHWHGWSWSLRSMHAAAIGLKRDEHTK